MYAAWPTFAAPPTAADADVDVSTVSGIGPRRTAQLHAAGVPTARALARLTAEQEESLVAAGFPRKTLRTAMQAAIEHH